jgi:hypothetical protein
MFVFWRYHICVPYITCPRITSFLLRNEVEKSKLPVLHSATLRSAQIPLVCRQWELHEVWRVEVRECLYGRGGAQLWADSAAHTRALRLARPDPCFGSTTGSLWTTAERTRIPWVSCRRCLTTCPTAAVGAATRRNSRYDRPVPVAQITCVVKMTVFYDVAPCSLVEVYRRFSKHPWNVGKLLPDYTVQHPRRQPSSYSPPWELDF